MCRAFDFIVVFFFKIMPNPRDQSVGQIMSGNYFPFKFSDDDDDDDYDKTRRTSVHV